MKPLYRLTPKPGIARVGRFVHTKNHPIIISGKPNIVKTTDSNASKTPKEQQVQKVIIKKPEKRAEVRRNDRRKPRSPAAQPSALKVGKELEMGRYKKLIEDLQDCGKGRILVMVACGPSISEADLPKLKNHPLIDFMSINRPDMRIHPTKYWVFCDQSQYLRNKELFDKYPGKVINTWSVRARHPNQVLIRNKSGKGFSKNLLQGYYIGRSTTFANMQTAYWMNYDKVYIFGCDMCKPPNSEDLHFYGTNQDVDPAIRVKRFSKEAEHYIIGAQQLNPVERKKFVFCSAYNPWPFVKEFEYMDHREAVDHILAKANEMQGQK